MEVEVTAQRVNLATQQAEADRLAARLRELGEDI
jgi:hypothetical protein